MTERLRKEIERALHRTLRTPKDFEYLKECIFARLHIMVSNTTLMRIWGYVDEPVTPRRSTLDILARYLGYNSLEEYEKNATLPEEQQSSPVLNRRLSVSEELRPGDIIHLSWLPDRRCDIEYEGDLKFRVIESENTRIRKGDTFECSTIIEGEPLYLDNLVQEGCDPIAYVCGKKNGVRFES